jgi:hypothetical protein
LPADELKLDEMQVDWMRIAGCVDDIPLLNRINYRRLNMLGVKRQIIDKGHQRSFRFRIRNLDER